MCVSDQPGCPCCYEIPVIKSKFSSVETGRKKVKKRIQTYHTELVDEESIRRWRHPHTTVHVYVKTLPTGAEAGFTVQVLSCKAIRTWLLLHHCAADTSVSGWLCCGVVAVAVCSCSAHADRCCACG